MNLKPSGNSFVIAGNKMHAAARRGLRDALAGFRVPYRGICDSGNVLSDEKRMFGFNAVNFTEYRFRSKSHTLVWGTCTAVKL